MIDDPGGVYPFWKLLIDGAALVISTGSALFVWYWRRHQATRDAFDALKGQVTALIGEVDILRNRVAAKPGAEAVHEIGDRMTRIEGALEVMGAQMKGGFDTMRASSDGTKDALDRIAAAVNRHEDHLLNKSS